MKNRIIFKLFIVVLLFVIAFANLPTYATTTYKDVPANHWASNLIGELQSAGILEPNDIFGLGEYINAQQLYELLIKFPNKSGSANSVKSDYNNQNLKRLGAIEQILTYFNYDSIANQLNSNVVPFIDVTSDRGFVQIAYDFGFVSLSSNKLFRPNDLIRKEEAVAILYNIYNKQNTSLAELHSYYAISSFGQSALTEDLTSLSYGWSRLEFNSDQSDVILNMTSSNNNEYRVPSGYNSALLATNYDSLKKQLMVFVKDDKYYDDLNKSSITLAEYIISHPKAVDSVINQIIQASTKNGYDISFDGVVIDFEGLKGTENAKLFNAFLLKLNTKLEINHLSLYVAVHPARKADQIYYDGYDFKMIGSIADYVILMAHDYYPKRLTQTDMTSGYTITPLTPIAEIYTALSAITDVELGVEDRSKILLQLSMDSVQWKLIDGEIVNSVPYHPSYSSIATRIKEGAMFEYSTSLQSPFLIFQDTKDNSRNIIWYEDERSVQAKIDLAKYFSIGGVSVWRLGTIPVIENEDNKLPLYLNIWNQIMKNYK